MQCKVYQFQLKTITLMAVSIAFLYVFVDANRFAVVTKDGWTIEQGFIILR